MSASTNRFARRIRNGYSQSICTNCFLTITNADDQLEIAELERNHEYARLHPSGLFGSHVRKETAAKDSEMRQ